MAIPALLFLAATRTIPYAGTYRLYASAMAGGVYGNAPAGTLTLRNDSTYTADGRSGRFTLSGSTARFTSGAYAGGTATFSRRAGHLRVSVTTGYPDHPGRKLKLFGNRV